MPWYSLKTIAGREQKQKNLLLNKADKLGLSYYIKNAIVPEEKIIKDNKTINKRLFPGYIFADLILTDEVLKFIKELDNIGFITKPPIPIQDYEINRINNIVEEAPKSMIKPGDNFEVTGGPFDGFKGTIVSVNNEKNLVKSLINIFGRDTVTELNMDQINLL